MGFIGVVGKLSFAAFLVSLAVGLVAAFGTRFHLWGFEVGLLKIFPFCLYAGIAGLFLGIVWGIGAMFMNSSAGARYGVIGLVGSIAVLALPMYNLYQVKVLHAIPPIHDITTDTEHPPQFVALLHNRPGALNPPDYEGNTMIRTDDGTSSTVTALQKKYYSDIRAPEQFITPARLFDHALAAARVMGWHIVAANRQPDGGEIEATDTTFFFGFIDDIAIRVERSGMGARLDIRSESRVGTSDLGRNAARIRAYVKQLANA